MKKTLTLAMVVWCALSTTLHAQTFDVTVSPISGANLYLNQLTSFTIGHSGTQSVQVSINYGIYSLNQEQLATGSLSNVSLNPGINLFNNGSHNLSYQITNPSFAVDQFGALPNGSYRLCVSVSSSQVIEPPAQACSNVDVILIAPPFLALPRDKEEVFVLNPILSWLPPTPALAGGFTYTLKLAEVLNNQNPYDAVLNNPALLEQNNINSNSLPYPLTAQGLQYGKTYAWKIFAYQGQSLIGETEVWSFTPIIPDTATLRAKNSPVLMVIPDERIDKTPVTVQHVIRLQSEDFTQQASLNLQVYTLGNDLVPAGKYTLTKGDNGVFTLTFRSPSEFNNQQLRLVATLPKGQKLFATVLFKSDN